MKKLLLLLGVSMLVATVQAAPDAEKRKYEALLTANFLNGWCQAKLQSGLVTVDSTGRSNVAPVKLTPDEQDQCDYVKQGLSTRCFERGDCPNYEAWQKARMSRK